MLTVAMMKHLEEIHTCKGIVGEKVLSGGLCCIFDIRPVHKLFFINYTDSTID